MIYARGKNCKSQTPMRGIQQSHKITQLVGITKKSDPFLRELREVYDKENLNPNIKQNRVKSQYNKGNYHHQGRSPREKVSINRQNKISHIQSNEAKATKQIDLMNSNSKYTNSTELHRVANHLKASNRKSTEKEEGLVSHFQEEYYSVKEQHRQKKMRVTLRDIKRHRKSIHQSEQDYLGHYEEDTKDSLTKDLNGSLRTQVMKIENNECVKSKIEDSGSKNVNCAKNRCCNHPDKKATHRSLEGDIIYCEKCAVTLATKGHKMQQLSVKSHNVVVSQEDIKQQRFVRLKELLFSVDRMEPFFRQTQSEIANYRWLSQKKFQDEKNNLDNYYNRIKQQVHISHQKSLFNLKMFFESSLQQLQKNDELLQRSYQDIKTIKEDIFPNINSIIEEQRVSQESFEEIIRNYCQKLRESEFHMKRLSECSYDSYYCNYGNHYSILLQFRQMIAPQIYKLPIKQHQETSRNGTEKSIQRQLDPFRLSFGKEAQDYPHKNL